MIFNFYFYDQGLFAKCLYYAMLDKLVEQRSNKKTNACCSGFRPYIK